MLNLTYSFSVFKTLTNKLNIVFNNILRTKTERNIFEKKYTEKIVIDINILRRYFKDTNSPNVHRLNIAVRNTEDD